MAELFVKGINGQMWVNHGYWCGGCFNGINFELVKYVHYICSYWCYFSKYANVCNVTGRKTYAY